MELEKQVCSLELSKKLKELGVPQDSYFVWHGDGSEEYPWRVFSRSKTSSNIPAFTVAELGEMLPLYIVKDGFSLDLVVIRSSVWRLHYGMPDRKESIIFTAGSDDTEADARAKMLIYLIENNLIEV